MELNPLVHIQNVAQDVYENVSGDWKNILPYLSMYFCVHMFAEHVIPSIFPNPYKWTDGTGKVHPKQLAKLMRTRVISVLMAVWVCVECWKSKMDPSAQALQEHLYGSTPVTLTLTRVAVAHFIWDIVICILDREQASYQFHAWACFLVFACSLRPFLHYMSIVVLFFEAGTPFLHVRQLMIKAGKTDIYGGIPFWIAQTAFFSLFFYSRIWIGYYECYKWILTMQAALEAGTVHNPSVVYLYFVLCFSLSALNGWWFLQMLMVIFSGKKKSKSTKTETVDV